MSKKTSPETSNIITVDLDDLGKLVYDGSDIIMEPAAENALCKLLELEARIAGGLATAKRTIEQKALQYNPNFTSVQAHRVKVGYQFFGSKYSVDESKLDRLDKELYKTRTSYSPVGPAIDKFAKEHGKLPLGIIERERTKTITIKPIEQFSEAENG